MRKPAIIERVRERVTARLERPRNEAVTRLLGGLLFGALCLLLIFVPRPGLSG